ncbi:MAG TPA: hypothetical protein VGF97_08900 [Rhizomicrobium sp.]|jgi:hypothetical protein
MADMDAFADDLLQAKGLSKPGQADYDGQKTELLDEIDEQIDAMILGRLPDGAKDAFLHVQDGQDEEKLENFLLTFIPDLQYQMDKVLLDFRETYLG